MILLFINDDDTEVVVVVDEGSFITLSPISHLHHFYILKVQRHLSVHAVMSSSLLLLLLMMMMIRTFIRSLWSNSSDSCCNAVFAAVGFQFVQFLLLVLLLSLLFNAQYTFDCISNSDELLQCDNDDDDDDHHDNEVGHNGDDECITTIIISSSIPKIIYHHHHQHHNYHHHHTIPV
jgi:hypothetical protein